MTVIMEKINTRQLIIVHSAFKIRPWTSDIQRARDRVSMIDCL